MSKGSRYAIIAVVLVAAGVGAYALGTRLRPSPPPAGTALEEPVPVAGLSLVNQTGAGFNLAGDLRGNVTLVFFGFTRCPNVCPLTMSRLAEAYRAAGAPEDLNVVMVSVNPAYDTPEVIGAFVARFNPSFIGLTGTNQQVAAAATAFLVGYGGAGVDMVHSEYVAVVDRQARLRYVYGTEALLSLAGDLPALLATL